MAADYAEVVRAKLRAKVYERDDKARERARRAAAKRPGVRATAPIECACCGEEFRQRLHVQRYCSKTCQKRAAMQRYRATCYGKKANDVAT